MRQHEEAEQIAIMNWAEWKMAEHPDLYWLFHIPNGGHRNKATAARLKAAGVKRGVPDLCLPKPRGGYHGLYIELKADSKGRPTPDQKKWLEQLAAAGYRAVLCHGYDEAVSEILAYILEKKGTGI